MRTANRACRFLQGVSSDAERICYSEATIGCARSIELLSKLYMAYQAKGISYMKQGQHDEATEAWLDAADYRSKLAHVYCCRGTACFQLGEYEKAFCDFDKTVEMEPDNFVALHNRGCANNRLGRTRQAESDFMKARELNAELAAAYTNPEVFTSVYADEGDLFLALAGG